MIFEWIDWIPILGYFALLLWLTFKKRGEQKNETSFLLSGRTLTVPAFVATLVSTWYGGILGVGEYTYQFGISQWLLFGFPFYIFAAIYAWFLAPAIRKHKALSIPEALESAYGTKAGRAGAVGIFILVSPAPYILMTGLILQVVIGGTNWFLYSAIIALFSAFYVSWGGFGAVVRTDILQIILMYGGFAILIYACWQLAGSPLEVMQNLPETHLDVTGSHSAFYIMVWFFIALWTFVDPGFHQRVAAAKSPRIAQKGIFTSIVFWFFFDIMSLTAGLYAFHILGSGLENPVLAYPELANMVLPAGLLGLFYIALIAVIMSTLDSYLFISGQTLGRDFLKPIFNLRDSIKITQISIFIAAFFGLLLLAIFPSVIELWYVLGSLVIPALLIPILGVYIPFFRLSRRLAFASIVSAFTVSLVWVIMGVMTSDTLYSYAWLGVEPFYPGLVVSLLLFGISRFLGNR